MKILLIASGGDAPGMNKFIAQMQKKFGNSLYACKGGFKALYDNEIYPIRLFDVQPNRNSAGCCIKSGRFAEFKQRKYFNKALENAKRFDYVVVMGGNGSKKGVKELSDNGVKAIFVPATIDNDVEKTDYSIGFHTAVAMVCFAVRNVMPSMDAHNRGCVFEVMGRHCPAIAQNAAKILQADVLVENKEQLKIDEIAQKIKKNRKKEHSSIIIIRENIVNAEELSLQLNQIIGEKAVMHFVVGHLQRGGRPTSVELKMAKQFAHAAIKAIKNQQSGVAVAFENGKTVLQNI